MNSSKIERYDRPFFFFGLSLFIPWVLWFSAAYISHLPKANSLMLSLQGTLAIAGLLSPVFVAAYLFFTNKGLYDDLKTRIYNHKRAGIIYIVLAFSLIFLSMVVAQLISILFGHSIEQFYISGSPGFTSAVFSPWFILVFAPIAEELAWHSYGTDTLRRRFNLFHTSIIFSVYWVFWHFPLSFINGYYHSNLVAEGWLYSLNFIFSLFVFVIIMNWLYYKTNRNILITVVFHCSANVSNEIFATHPDSKVIQTVLLLFFAVFIMFKDKNLFFKREYYE